MLHYFTVVSLVGLFIASTTHPWSHSYLLSCGNINGCEYCSWRPVRQIRWAVYFNSSLRSVCICIIHRRIYAVTFFGHFPQVWFTLQSCDMTFCLCNTDGETLKWHDGSHLSHRTVRISLRYLALLTWLWWSSKDDLTKLW